MIVPIYVHFAHVYVPEAQNLLMHFVNYACNVAKNAPSNATTTKWNVVKLARRLARNARRPAKCNKLKL